ncbi:unnamed protein product [Kuraishia capsulata CBS 1993]|uniref:Protein ARV n=1 Tax=Kuraishia capsulata CBS 1993 TaxID=1382522 RepID=W6MX81_9ASCO|nr:uncharacterized protein KUCA_T00004412001 [Kuraishia capsulata CBS 1993]CDK28430.1 unnamed protein product [Kuraishia capsulata CBS 1993]
MICVECSEPIEALYYKYKGDHIKLTVCDVCHKVADKYVEYDNVLLFIDLMLLKQQAYRHLIYNHLVNQTNQCTFVNNPESTAKVSFIRKYDKTLRLLVLVLLFEVYLTWAYEEKNYIESHSRRPTATTRVILEHTNVLSQYAFFLCKAIIEFFLVDITVQVLLYFWLNFGSAETITFKKIQPHVLSSTLRRASVSPELSDYSDDSSSVSVVTTVQQFHYSRSFFVVIISTTILVSNLIKLFPIVMLIWPYDISILNLTKTLVQFIHTIILIETIHIVLLNNPKNDYWRVTICVLCGNIIKTSISQLILVSIVSKMFGLPWLELAKDEYLAIQQKALVFEELLK